MSPDLSLAAQGTAPVHEASRHCFTGAVVVFRVLPAPFSRQITWTISQGDRFPTESILIEEVQQGYVEFTKRFLTLEARFASNEVCRGRRSVAPFLMWDALLRYGLRTITAFREVDGARGPTGYDARRPRGSAKHEDGRRGGRYLLREKPPRLEFPDRRARRCPYGRPGRETAPPSKKNLPHPAPGR